MQEDMVIRSKEHRDEEGTNTSPMLVRRRNEERCRNAKYTRKAIEGRAEAEERAGLKP